MKQTLITLVALTALQASASGLESLDTFVSTVKSGHAEFTQVVTLPAKDGQTAHHKTSSGEFDFSRPNKFKFSYKKPFEQLIVADGRRVWMYDTDMNQVSSRKQSDVYAASPVALIASSSNMKAIEADFDLSPAPASQGIEWVVATPKSKDGMLQSIRIGFKDTHLEKIEILDGFGQRSLMTITAMQINPAMPSNIFQFKPPAGADVIQQ